MKNLELHEIIRKQGDILIIKDIDSEIGCTTIRHIIYNGKKYIHIMHNGETLSCTIA